MHDKLQLSKTTSHMCVINSQKPRTPGFNDHILNIFRILINFELLFTTLLDWIKLD